jgi:hypothetical protein
MINEGPYTLSASSKSNQLSKIALAKKLRDSNIPDIELLDNLELYLTRPFLSRINFIQNLYKHILPVHGCIMEFGVRWGRNMALFSNLRGMYEPFNYNRHIIGFDTFSGFPSVAREDGELLKIGDYSTNENWVSELTSILKIHQDGSPIADKEKFKLVVGDAGVTLPQYLRDNPQTIISLAYFDFDLYKPTRDCLEAILPYLTKGSILAFDELNAAEFPGETIALREVIGLSTYKIQRDPSTPLASFLVIE